MRSEIVRMAGWGWILAMTLIAAACQLSASGPSPAPMLRSELYFERVDTDAWDAFLADEITPRFPDGLTWWDVNGQWRGPSGGPEKMPSRLLVVLHAGSAHNEQSLQDIARLFHARFGTHVLIVSQPAHARDADWTEQRIRSNPQLGNR